MTDPATIVAATGTGLTAGVYLAFSVLVMPALAAAPPASALTAMQRINELAQRPLFGLVFAAAAIGSSWVVLGPWLTDAGRQPWPSVGALLSLAAFLVTVVVNVPRNRRLARLGPGATADLVAWPAISRQWRWGNNVRAGCATLGLVAFMM